MPKVKKLIHEGTTEIKEKVKREKGFGSSPSLPEELKDEDDDDAEVSMSGGEECPHKPCSWTASENHQAVRTDDHMTRSHQSELIEHIRDEHDGVLGALCVCQYGADECREKELWEIGNEEEIA